MTVPEKRFLHPAWFDVALEGLPAGAVWAIMWGTWVPRGVWESVVFKTIVFFSICESAATEEGEPHAW